MPFQWLEKAETGSLEFKEERLVVINLCNKFQSVVCITHQGQRSETDAILEAATTH